MGDERERTGSWRHAETQETLESVETLLSMRVPALTLLYHPDLERVGEQCRLVSLPLGKGCALGRLEPVFSAVGVTRGEPLADARLSRRPVWLEHVDGGGVRIDVTQTSTPVVCDGEPVVDYYELSAARVTAGVVLELASRFVMLLHSIGRAHERSPRLGLVGDNESIERLRGDILRVADLDVPVLLRGESGTGKELVAQAIHGASSRASRPCVVVNMGAITRTTAASELFGHVRGSFTGASRDHDGYFVRADNGTLFMDEVGEMPAELQVMLLRTLETGEIQPVGAPRKKRVSVRLIAATDADLEKATEEGTFRLPLLHRLAGYEVVIPPLRDRKDDIARLFIHFLRLELEALGESWRLDPVQKGSQPWLAASIMARLVRYEWPGNVRQLRNVARQMVISSRGAEVVRVDPAVERLLGRRAPRPAIEVEATPTNPAPAAAAPAHRKRPSELTEDELLVVLRRHEYRLGPVAKELGMSRTTLYALIERSDRFRKARDLSEAEIRAALTGSDVGRASRQLEVSKRGLQLRMKELGLA